MEFVPQIAFALTSGAAAIHALLNKRDPRSAFGWIILCIILPVVGPVLYLLAGINRQNYLEGSAQSPLVTQEFAPDVPLDHPLDRITSRLSRYPCTSDNNVRLLRNGEQAYPEMLKCISSATQSIYLSTYIFDSDDTGKRFVEALSLAVQRGVTVRVLVDRIGGLYSYPSTVKLLHQAGIPASRFLPLLHRDGWKFNMRNHRKILAVDESIAFTGGMNIGNRHLVESVGKAVADVQLRIDGSAARALAAAFRTNWLYVTGESLRESSANTEHLGSVYCRPIMDGPGNELGTLPWLLLGLIGAAKSSITILTPYFLPPPAIIGALTGAALRGVRVRVLLPEKSNLPFINWATNHSIIPILHTGIELYLTPAPFSHTKMLLIDDDFLQVGSYNMDSRSLRLNLELAVNVYDLQIRKEIDAELAKQFNSSRLLKLEAMHSKNLLLRIRNALAWLMVPYL